MPDDLRRRVVTRGVLPLETRLMPIGTVDAQARTVECVFSSGARVRRYDWANERYYDEELVVSAEAVRLDRLNAGAPVLDTHMQWELRNVIGVVERAWLAGAEARALLRFSDRAEVEPVWRDIAVNKILRNVSVGYRRLKVERVAPPQEGGIWVYRVVEWEPFEISPVPIGADAGAQFRSAGAAGPAQQQRSSDCEFIDFQPPETAGTSARKEPTMPQAQAQGTPAAAAAGQQQQDDTRLQAAAAPAAPLQAPAAADAALAAARAEGARAEAQRQADIRALGTAPAVRALGDEFLRTLAADPQVSVDEARRRILDELGRRSDARSTRSAAYIETVTDETETRRAAIVDALFHRMDPRGTLPDPAREYRYLSLRQIAEVCLDAQGVRTRGLAPMELAARAMSTSDLPSLLGALVNKRLRAAYEENVGTYRRWARRAPNAPDFKAINVVQLSAAPDLIEVKEGGEFKYGAMSDGKETYAVITYGRIVPFTRQALVNDDLRGLDRLITAFSASAARLENRLVYMQLTANAALADGVALFHANHNNLAGSGAAISDTTLGAGRAAMRRQTGLQGEELNLAPAFLIAPATQEQKAYQYTSAQFVPATATAINEFRAGGRTALEPIIEAYLDSASTTAWYLAANSGAIDTVEYCWLEGSEGVYTDSEMGFDIDGLKTKARLDFAAKAIDFRGLYKNAGA